MRITTLVPLTAIVAVLVVIPTGAAASDGAAPGPDVQLAKILDDSGSTYLAADDVTITGLKAAQVLDDLRAVLPGISDDEVVTGLTTRRARAQLTEAMATEKAFGGQWFDWSSGTWHVSSLTPDLASWASRQMSELGVPVQWDRADFSWATLAAAMESVVRNADAAGDDRFSIRIDARSNRVVLRGDRALIPANFENEVRSDGPYTDSVDYVFASCANRWSCSPPLAGGVNIASVSSSTSVGSAGCSIGFTGVAAATGARYAYTAGHCITASQVASQQAYYQGSHFLGNAKATKTGAAWDAALVSVTASYWLTGTGGFLQTSLSAVSDVDYAITSLATIDVGDVVCELGVWYGSGVDNCGVLVAENAGGKPQVQGLRTCHGDSGGSVYLFFSGTLTRWAYGLVSVANIPNGQSCTANGGSSAYMSFSALPWINTVIDTDLPNQVLVETR